MIAKDPVQSLLEACIQALNPIYNGNEIPVTTTFVQDVEDYVMLMVSSYNEDGTDDNYIYDVVLRAEAITEFITGEERETPSNEIMNQVTQTLTDLDFLNGYLTEYEAIVVSEQSMDRDTQQDNVSSIISKRKDFTIKIVQK